MSILKYNNNGTWEGLNIDHASTADSALYDADGNVISSTYAKTTDLGLYLPLTAGSSNRLSGNLFLDSSSTQDIYFYQSGTRRAKLEMQSNNGAYIMAKCDTDGNSLAGVDVTVANNAILFADGSDDGVFVRPNGLGTTTGQVWFKKSGQQIGGHPRSSYTRTTTTSVSGNTVTTVCSTGNVLESSGIYIVSGFCTYSPGSSSAHTPRIWLNNLCMYYYSAFNTTIPMVIFGIVYGVTNIDLKVSPQASAITGGSVSGATIEFVRVH